MPRRLRRYGTRDSLVGGWVDRLAGWWVGLVGLAGWWVGCLVVGLVGYWIGWLVGWLARQILSIPPVTHTLAAVLRLHDDSTRTGLVLCIRCP